MTFNEYWKRICEINNSLFFDVLTDEERTLLEEEKKELEKTQNNIVIQFI